jgi:protein disulfide-isomerase A6
MVSFRHLLVSSLTLLSVNAASSVIDLIPDNFDDIVLKSGKPALVEFFAPWCGHCKNLAPIYEELAASFAHAGEKVTIAKVDADENKSLGRRFDVKGYPTLKWFDGVSEKPIDYNSGRDIESLTSFITEKTGIKAKGKKAEPNHVQILTDSSFDAIIGKDKDVLVAFTAPWCGHCKSLKAPYGDLAATYQTETSVVIAQVDAEAENSKATAKRFGVSSYPTIKFFPKGSTTPVDYSGGRTEKDFITYINEKAGLHRVAGGGLDATAGTIEILNAIVSRIQSGDALSTLATEAKAAAVALTDSYAKYYVKVFDKLVQSEGYAKKELNRLQSLVKKGGISLEKTDDLLQRINILKIFTEDKGKEDL